MMSYGHNVVVVLLLLIPRHSAILSGAETCVKGCRQRVDKECYDCLKLCEVLQNTTSQENGSLLTPDVPVLVNSSFTSIRLSWDTKAGYNGTGLLYILEVRPIWPYTGDNIFQPFIPKCHKTSDTVLTVNQLPARTNYTFRVLVMSYHQVSSFSNWSTIITTNDECTKYECHVTNMRLKLQALLKDKDGAKLNSTFHWNVDTTIKFPHNYILLFKFTPKEKGNCCGPPWSTSGTRRPIVEGYFTNNTPSYFETPQHERLYFGCRYDVEIHVTTPITVVMGPWEFRIPECVTSLTQQKPACGCPECITNVKDVPDFGTISLKRMSSDANRSSVNIRWSDAMWREDINLTYFHVILGKKNAWPNARPFVNAVANVHEYNVTIDGLENEYEYEYKIFAYHRDHCAHGDRGHRTFYLSYPCEPNPCPPNSSCIRTGYRKGDVNYRCDCMDGYVKAENVCKVRYPCRTVNCSENERCHVTDETTDGFSCICKERFTRNDEGDCVIPVISPEKDSLTSGQLAASIVTPLLLVCLIAASVIYCLRQQQHKRLRMLANVVDSVHYNNNASGTLTNPYGFQPATVRLPKYTKYDKEDDRELNVLYVPQEISEAIAQGLTNGVLEVAPDRLKFGGIIDRGAFGEVYIAEAHEIGENPEWTKVAVKTLAEQATDEEVCNFMGEIELMKKLGEHTNVIRMFGCCTLGPVCLIMEFAVGGSLLRYLKSLKRKCVDGVKLSDDSNKDELPVKEKYEKFFEPGELSQELGVCSFPQHDSCESSSEHNSVQNMQERNKEIAAKVNEHIRTALNPKELESFACQIANGMAYVASLGIIHRDLAARNILLDENHTLKISDFGLSREEEFYVKRTGGKIPLRWLSIEAIQARRYSTASDVWAFGIILWEICTLGDVPYPSVSDKDLLDFLVAGQRMSKPSSCTEDIFQIMLQCWSQRPVDRPTFDRLTATLSDLERQGTTYVNFAPLAAFEQNADAEVLPGKPNQVNKDDEPVGKENGATVFDNRGFSGDVDDHKCDDKVQILPDSYKEVQDAIQPTI